MSHAYGLISTQRPSSPRPGRPLYPALDSGLHQALRPVLERGAEVLRGFFEPIVGLAGQQAVERLLAQPILIGDVTARGARPNIKSSLNERVFSA
jgi:hypothetical protein